MSLALQFVALASDVFAIYMSMSMPMSMLTCFVFNNLDRNHSACFSCFASKNNRRPFRPSLMHFPVTDTIFLPTFCHAICVQAAYHNVQLYILLLSIPSFRCDCFTDGIGKATCLGHHLVCVLGFRQATARSNKFGLSFCLISLVVRAPVIKQYLIKISLMKMSYKVFIFELIKFFFSSRLNESFPESQK